MAILTNLTRYDRQRAGYAEPLEDAFGPAFETLNHAWYRTRTVVWSIADLTLAPTGSGGPWVLATCRVRFPPVTGLRLQIGIDATSSTIAGLTFTVIDVVSTDVLASQAVTGAGAFGSVGSIAPTAGDRQIAIRFEGTGAGSAVLRGITVVHSLVTP
jgi:hypothetical protein